MELALAAAGFTKYAYSGKATILFDDHHDEYEADFITGDHFAIKSDGREVIIVHDNAPKVKFVASTTDKKYIKLMRSSTALEFEFVPTPKYPQYPFIPNITFEMIPMIYAYMNKTYFNGMCPESLLFKKTTVGDALGVATYNKVGGRYLFRMLINMRMIGSDMILFIDILLHEMIHLYIYVKGLAAHDNTILLDGHGPYFKAEMSRLNRLGFNISSVLEWEDRTIETSEFNLIRITLAGYPDHAKYYWSSQPLERDFDNIVAQLTKFDPTSLFTIDLFATSDAPLRKYPVMGKNGKLPAAKLNLWWKTTQVKGRILKTFTVTPQSSVDANQYLKVPKAEEVHYAQPMSIFGAWLRRTKVNTNSEGYIQSMWVRFPVAKILPYAAEELIEINKAVGRGMADADINRRLTAVFARFDGRCNQYAYRTVIRAIIVKHKLDALLQYPQLGL